MPTRAELKTMAKQQIKGNIGILFLCGLVFLAVFFAAGIAIGLINVIITLLLTFINNIIPEFIQIMIISIVSFITGIPVILLAPAFVLSFAMIFIALTYGQKPRVADIFKGLTTWGKAFLLYLLVGIFVFLWSLLFIIPGIIKAFSYSMSWFVLAENPHMTAREALNESKMIMKGHKWQLFVLGLSFILWFLLGYITIGIAFIYIIPYFYATIANFYNAIKRTPEPVQIEGEAIPA